MGIFEKGNVFAMSRHWWACLTPFLGLKPEGTITCSSNATTDIYTPFVHLQTVDTVIKDNLLLIIVLVTVCIAIVFAGLLGLSLAATHMIIKRVYMKYCRAIIFLKAVLTRSPTRNLMDLTNALHWLCVCSHVSPTGRPRGRSFICSLLERMLAPPHV